MAPNWAGPAWAAVSFIGFADASYLAAEAFLKAIPPCTIGGCEAVLTSAHAHVAGIPLAFFGAAFYLAVFLLSVFYIQTRLVQAARMIVALSCVGFLASLWFVYIQLVILGAICPYCMVSAGTSTLLFIVSLAVFLRIGLRERIELS